MSCGPVDPSAEYTQLEALRSACQWVLYGPERANGDYPGILDSPINNPYPGHHFGVADRLRQLPCGWLHVGRLIEVPLAACYKAHHGDTWVWVDSEGMKGLAEFTLVLLDIATLDLNDGDASQAPPVLVTLIRQPSTFYMLPEANWESLKTKLNSKLNDFEDPNKKLILDDQNKKLILDDLKHRFATGILFSQPYFDDTFQKSYYWQNYGRAITNQQDQKAQTNYQQDPIYLLIEKEIPFNKPPIFTDGYYLEYRIIKPEHWREVSQRIQQATDNQKPIEIPWDEWSTPYHNQRTAAKQNTNKAPTAAAAQKPPPERGPGGKLTPWLYGPLPPPGTPLAGSGC